MASTAGEEGMAEPEAGLVTSMKAYLLAACPALMDFRDKLGDFSAFLDSKEVDIHSHLFRRISLLCSLMAVISPCLFPLRSNWIFNLIFFSLFFDGASPTPSCCFHRGIRRFSSALIAIFRFLADIFPSSLRLMAVIMAICAKPPRADD